MLSEALRLIRVFHDLKQTELAQRLGISKSYLSEIESGKKPSRMDLIERYSSEFGIPSSSILFFAEGLDHPSRSAKGARRCHDEELSRAAGSFTPDARNDSGHRRKVIGLGPESLIGFVRNR